MDILNLPTLVDPDMPGLDKGLCLPADPEPDADEDVDADTDGKEEEGASGMHQRCGSDCAYSTMCLWCWLYGVCFSSLCVCVRACACVSTLQRHQVERLRRCDLALRPSRTVERWPCPNHKPVHVSNAGTRAPEAKDEEQAHVGNRNASGRAQRMLVGRKRKAKPRRSDSACECACNAASSTRTTRCHR